MKHKLVLVMFVLCLMTSVALAQTDAATPVATDDATMARLRVAYLVFKGPDVDVLVDGEIANNGGRELRGIPCCEYGFYGHIYLSPGTHSVAVVPTGKSVEEALLEEDVDLEAGHRYTLAVIGQVTDEHFTPLLVNETEAAQAVRTEPDQNVMILINNLAGTETLSFAHDGQGPQNIPYLGFVAAPVPSGPVEQLAITTDAGTIYEGPFVATFERAIDYLGSFTGRFPGTEEVDFVYQQGFAISDSNALEFMRTFSGLGMLSEGEQRPVSFDTFLAAIEAAGLSEMLASGPYLVFAPTDEAFAALPEGRLDELMADSEALAEVLEYHIAKGYYPPGTLGRGRIDRTIKNLQGEDLKLLDSSINGVPMSHYSGYYAANGVRINPINRLLMPPER